MQIQGIYDENLTRNVHVTPIISLILNYFAAARAGGDEWNILLT